ncbi:MAG: TrkH family potassium uptake protein [Neisseriaceae bacterium]|nr:TrkH family potassium uptake protein [Neisseriaceae bacterium]MBR1819073.1 TrkH family potassium uptake protein [Neisseriaceae bacterium]
MYRLLPVLHTLFKLSCLFSPILLLPAIVSWLYLDGLMWVHLGSAAFAFISSSICWLATKPFKKELRTRDGFLLATGLWVGFAAVAAVPFYFGVPQMSPIEAYFEAVSGLTTTGATMIASLDTLAPSLNFWRHLLNWIGGLGIIILAVAILPMLGVGGMQLFRSEVSGLNKGSRFMPRIRQMAKSMWLIYIIFTLITLFALRFAGMSWFDALCHAMSCIALGGFSTHSESIAYFNSPLIESILIIGMILGAISFTNHFSVLQQRNLKIYWRDLEVRSTLFLIVISTLIMAFSLWVQDFYPFGEAIRHTLFAIVSIGTACGYSTENFGAWPLASSLWLFFLANVLANAGSTGGGIKMIRLLVLVKFMLREMTLLLHPKAVRMVKINDLNIPERTALTVLAFVFVYFASVVSFSFILMASGFDFVSAVSTVVSCITNTGPALGITDPSHSSWLGLSNFQKITCSIIMLVGRLEVVTVFILFTPAYWRR